MTQEEGQVPSETVRSGYQKKTDSNPAKKHTLTQSYDEEGDYDIDNAIWDLHWYKKFKDIGKLKSALRFIKNAIKEYGYAEHLRGNTLEPYLEEDEKT